MSADLDDLTDPGAGAPPVTYPPGELPTGPAFDGQGTVPMLMSQFIGYLENLIRLATTSIGKMPEGAFFCVVVPMAGRAICHSHAHADGLVAELRSLYGQETQVFAFNGTRLGIAKGGGYLFTPWGNYPLYVQNPAAEPDDDGFMGDVPQFVAPPAEPENGDDEDEDEEDEADD
jgi:hypothetical protein